MAGVYISYPFCAQKCTYCNFASGVFPRELEPRYVDALVAEIASHHWAWRPETVYLGGGTPSRMDPRRSGADPGCDSRARPGAKPPWKWRRAPSRAERAAAWVRAGINRVSLGVQSFVQRELARTGRKHTAEIVAARDRRAARGRPREHQHRPDRRPARPDRGVLARIARRGSSAFSRRTSPSTCSKSTKTAGSASEVLLNGKRYGAPDVPSDELTAELYETAVDELRRLGIHRYEISNFARPGFESLHNLKYWRLEPYVGLRRGRAFLRRRDALPECRIAAGIRRANPQRPVAAHRLLRPPTPPKNASSSDCG